MKMGHLPTPPTPRRTQTPCVPLLDLRRLFPTAYTEDADHDAGYQILGRAELVEQRRDDLQQLLASDDGQDLTAETLESWMRVVNNLRLVLGTMLDVGEDDIDPEEGDPLFESYEVYHLLGVVLEEIVGALSGELPD